jgi:hypothetical protein
MKKAFLLLLTLTLAAASYAADTKPIEDVFQRYWAVYSKKDFIKAAAEVMPSDLEGMRKEVLPVFLANQNAKSKDGQIIVGAFFDKTVGKAREAMSGADVLAGLNRIVAAGSPEMFEAFKEAKMDIVFVRTMTPDTAEVHFQVSVRGGADMDAETMAKKDGRWWIRVKDDPKATADNFKEMLAKAN